ncbi:MAG TPA: neuraminidase-like domain-containing protein, partial [Kofleriaceae bacterium]|nr:neuraminidase-like domain-containing protein [Kofleriaceae bacterium]
MVIDKSQLTPGATGASVNILHLKLVLLGFEVPVDELQSDRYGSGTEAAVRRFQTAHGLPVAHGRVDDETARGLGLGGYPTSVAGIVCRPDGAPLPNVAVRLCQHIGGVDKVVAEARSDGEGKFAVPWPQGLSGGLTICAEGGAEKALSWKEALSRGSIWVRLSVGGEYRGASRFAVLTQALAPVVDAHAFHAIGGAGRAAELTALAEAARVPRPDISRYVLAHKLAAKTRLAPPVCFALLTYSVTPETLASFARTAADAEALDDAHVEQVLNAALAHPRDELRRDLAAAVANNVISDVDLDATAAALHALRVEHLGQQPISWGAPPLPSDEHACCAVAAAPIAVGTDRSSAAALMDVAQPLVVHDAPLRDVIAAALPDPAAQGRVLEAFADHGSHANLSTVVDSVAGLSPDQRDHLRFTLEAAALLGNHLPLVRQVQELRAAKKISTTRDLARFDEMDWAELLGKADPDGSKISSAAHPAIASTGGRDRVAVFARALATRLGDRYPTTALAGRLAKGKAALPLTESAAVQRFLSRAPSFCIRHTNIDRFVHDMGADTLPTGGDHAQIIADLKTLQRGYKLTSRFDHVKAMLDAGHRSAHSIHAVGPEQFAAQMAAAQATADEADAMFARAEQVHATALTLMANFNSAFNGATPAAVAPALSIAPSLASLPTVQSLFGSADYCACSDCRSVHGPAAYLVDILELLKSRKAPDNTTSARDIVQGRRPDLKFIQLSCSNTNGVIPYVDLVCEILEDAVGAAPADVDVKARQTSGTLEELRANPAFVRDSAYTALASATFPITAPFDLFGVTVRAFLRQLGIARSDLMAAFQSSSVPTDTQIAAERFELSATALTVITTASPSTPWTLWNLQQTNNTVPDPRKPDDATANRTGTNLQIMAFVPILLDRAKLLHRELIQLLETRFINPNKVLSIAETGITVGGVSNIASCDTGLQSVTGWTDDLLTRFNRFIRLWRQLGCTIWDLDKVLAATRVGNALLDANAIAQLAKVDAIAKRLSLPWDELLTLWGPIDSADYINVLDPEEPVMRSVYKRKFRSATIAQVATVFPDDPSALTGNLDDANVIAGISAVLATSSDDLKRIRAAAGLATPPGGSAPALNLANLSAITRYATLAASLGLSISDLLTAVAVSGVNPFPTDVNALTPALTLQFMTAIDVIRDSGFTLLELSYLLRHDSVIDSGIGLSDVAITTWLDELRKALVRLGSTTTAAAADLVVQRISAMLPLDPTLTQQVVQAALPASPPTFVAASAVVTSRSNTLALSTPAATQGGDTLLAFAWSGETNDSKLDTAALPAGWELLSRIDTGTRQHAVLLRRIATDNEPASHTFSAIARGAGFPLAGVIEVYRGLAKNVAVVAAAVADVTTATTSFVCPSVNQTAASDLYVGFVAGHGTTGTVTAPAGSTKRFDQATAANGGAHCATFDLKKNAAGATGTQTATLSATDTGVAVSYVLKAVPATLADGAPSIAALFTDSSLTARGGDGSFTTATTRNNFRAIYEAYTALDKMRTLLTRWRVSNADALWLLQHAAAAGWMELHTLPVSVAAAASSTVTLTSLDVLHRNLVVQQTLANPAGGRLFDLVLSPGATVDAVAQKLAPLGGWQAADINALATRFSWTTPAQLVAGATVPRIRDLMAWPRRLGTDVATTLLFAAATVGSSEAAKARQLTKSRFSNEEWLSVSGGIQDRLREQKRAALVAYLLANPQTSRNQKWVTVQDLYGFFLIDPEMSPAAETTRIKQAVASLQLFVQRCFLQLEIINVDSDSVWKQWDWMKRFRLWEANRKIFLYPENWYDPAQRRDMSPYFAALVSDLQQTNLTNSVAEDALRVYLHKLVDVAHLEVSGLWEEPVSGTQPILHVVARTRKSPYVYSYRRRESTGAWSAWEPLDDAANANHVMPVIWNKRLFMLWTEFVDKAQPAADSDHAIPHNTEGTVIPAPKKYWEIALSWMERRNDIWLPRRQSQRRQLINGVFSNNTPVYKWQVVFRATTPVRSGTTLSNLALSLYEPTGPGSQALAQWILTSSQDEPLLLNIDKSTINAPEDMKYIAALPPGTAQLGSRPKFTQAGGAFVDMSYNFNAFGGDTPNLSGPLALQRPVGSIPVVTLLNTATMARVISVRFGDLDQFSSPFFISDPQRTFFATFSSSAWKLQAFYHPYVELFLQQLNQGGLPGLYDRTLQINPDSLRGMSQPFDFNATYVPNTDTTILATPYPSEIVDYAQSGPYAIYNWELFLHTPLLIAKRLADNQRFDEALRWFHYIFNPNTVNVGTSPGPVPARYWNPKIFRDLADAGPAAQAIEQLLALVNQGNTDLVARVTDWRNNPFDPNLVAAARPVAYQKAVVMAYISTLIAWGDQLFRGDTVESINEATQLYLLASQLLGPRPQSLRAIQPKQNKSYQDLGTSIDAFSNAMVDIENIVSVPPPATGGTPPTPTMLHTFYFCIPPNDQMLSYWDTVADRLFKLRHGMNLDGVTRPLSVFEPPIDPGLLARAAAAGIDISTALADAAVDIGCYRFQTLWQAAHDLCQDVRGLGAAILAAMERQDGEDMARLKATQDVAVTTAMREVKATQLHEAEANKTALQSSRAMAELRKAYYDDQARRDLMNEAEALAQDLNTQAQHNEEAALDHDRTASWMAWLPTANVGFSGFGGSPHLTVSFGVENFKAHIAALTAVLHGKAGISSRKAGQSTTFASYQRRQDEWDLQLSLAKTEIEQLDNQLIAADLRIAVAQRELDVQDRQIADAQDTAALLQSKFTNKELYSWMLSQLSSTYFQSYQLAYDLAKRASKAYSFDLGLAD